MISPHWTPELMPKSPFEDFPLYEDRIYSVFKSDFIDSHPEFNGLRVNVRRQLEESDGKWAGFFHITSVDDKVTGKRDVDLRRCERIRYPRQTIEHYDNCPQCSYSVCERPLAWWYRKGHRDRVHILIVPEKYLVVLEPHKDKKYCLLVTAYYVNREHSYNKLIRQYENASSAGDAIQ